MGGFAARKALRVVEHTEQVLAMELLAACQGMDMLKPLITTTPLSKVFNMVRSVSQYIDRDRFMSPEVDEVTKLLQDGQVWECVQLHLDSVREMESKNPSYLDTPIHSPTSVIKRSTSTTNIVLKGLQESAAEGEPSIKTAKFDL